MKQLNYYKKRYYSVICILSFLLSYGQQKISLEYARKIAENATQFNNEKSKKTKPKINLAYISTKNLSGNKKSLLNENEIYYYIFNINENDGFIAVSGNDLAVPVLTYSEEGNFNEETLPSALLWWLEQYKKDIQYAIDLNLKQTAETKQMWLNAETKSDYNSSSPNIKNTNAYVEGTNLVKARWSQKNPYNNLVHSKLGGNYATGCTATAMAQILYYWKYPEKTLNTIPEYTTKTLKIRVPSIDKGALINWENMIDHYGKNKYSIKQADAVAQLMYYVGASVKMNYNSSSGAWPSVEALIKYFGYDPGAKVEFRHKNKDTWDSILKSQIDLLQPMVYVGADDEIGARHSFICDGYKYQNGNLYFHFNWGWNGSGNNYCVTNAIIPDKRIRNYSRNKTYERIYMNIKPIATCSEPTGLTTSNISASKATLKWNSVNGVQNYTVEYKSRNDTSWKIVPIDTNSLILTNLHELTFYDWRVKTNCSSSNSSNYSQNTLRTSPTIYYTLNDNSFTDSSSTDVLSTISVYPNPVNNILYIKGLEFNGNKNLSLMIRDRNGKVVKTATIISGKDIALDVSELPPNLYFLGVNNHTLKFIKK